METNFDDGSWWVSVGDTGEMEPCDPQENFDGYWEVEGEDFYWETEEAWGHIYFE